MIDRRFRRIVSAVALAGVVMGSPGDAPAQSDDPLKEPKNGVSVSESGAYEGYSLVAPMNSTSTYLIDMQGRIVNEWKSEFTPALSAYLLENGHLLRPAVDRGAKIFDIPAVGGRIQEFDWEGELVWDFVLEREGTSPHHDICRLPNGNVLAIATQSHTKEEVMAAGRRPESLGNRLLVDCVLEIRPTGPTTGEIVWEWYAWDHLVQDVDPSKPNYGEVTEHPELIDINYGSNAFAAMTADPQQLARLRTLGYVGGGGPPGGDRAADTNGDGGAAPDGKDAAGTTPGADDHPPGGPPGGDRGGRRGPGIDGDWMHTNSIEYNADLDQIMLSVHGFNEVWIIDHGTTTAEAAAHTGGTRGKGGDLLYRWGNPQAYRNGSKSDQRLFGQHCAYWIPEGLPGAGHMLVFNNGLGRSDGAYSSVDEVVLPLMQTGDYEREEYLAFGPERAEWSYTAADRSRFNAMLISGAQRLPNGNTFICSGNQGLLFEVTAAGEIVWMYKHPGGGMGFPGFDGGRMGMFPEFVRRMLQTDEQQDQQLADLQKDVAEQLASVLTDDQRQRLDQPPRFPFGGPPGGGPPPGARPPAGGPPRDGRGGGPRGPEGRRPRGFRPPRFGEVISSFVVDSLELTNEQESQVAQVQAAADAKWQEILTDSQREQIDNWAKMFARGPGFGPPGGGPPGFGPPGPGGPPAGAPDDDRPDRDRAPRPPGRDGQDGDGPRGQGRPPRDGIGPPPGGPGFGGMFGGPGGPGGGPGRGPGGIFRSYRYGPEYPGLQDKDLTPGALLSEVAEDEQRPSNRRTDDDAN